METYLRLMFLKFRYGLGFESLCRETSDWISLQRFARIPFGTRVPHPSTLIKITTRWAERGRRAERRAAGEGSGGEGAEDGQGPRGNHGDHGGRRLSE